MNIVADLHTHTDVSHHALSSLEEMVRAAKNAGHVAIAVTNHGPYMMDGAHRWHFESLLTLPREIDGIVLIKGIELNITPPLGGIDPLQKRTMDKMEQCIASFHEFCYPPADFEAHTIAVESMLKNPYVNLLGHMGNPQFPFDMEYIISKCNEYNTAVEINNNSLVVRKGSAENCMQIAKLCKQYKVPVMVNSDSHFSGYVGKVDGALKMLEEIEFPESLVINASKENLRDYYLNLRNIDIFEGV